MYATGQGVAKDQAEMLKWWRAAAEQGDTPAQFNVGVSKISATSTAARGVPRDLAEALKWYGRAANQGNAFAQNSLD